MNKAEPVTIYNNAPELLTALLLDTCVCESITILKLFNIIYDMVAQLQDRQLYNPNINPNPKTDPITLP